MPSGRKPNIRWWDAAVATVQKDTPVGTGVGRSGIGAIRAKDRIDRDGCIKCSRVTESHGPDPDDAAASGRGPRLDRESMPANVYMTHRHWRCAVCGKLRSPQLVRVIDNKPQCMWHGEATPPRGKRAKQADRKKRSHRKKRG